MSTGQIPSSSYVNSFPISAVVDRLLVHVREGSRSDNNEFFNLCLSLARGIDYAIAHDEIPVRAPDLPYLLKQVCQRRDDTLLHAAIMVLMISIKSACKNGWFNAKDSEELYILSSEIASIFCSVGDMNSEEGALHHNISAVMSRFYPRMKMGKILASVEAKQGYGTFVNDFHVTKKTISSDDKICITVVCDHDLVFYSESYNTETSSCIISPQQVNFLLNGRAVDRRTCAHKDPRPQIPTLVTHMLKYGTNLLQAVGQFNGKYIIVVAFMSMVPIPSCPSLPDYVPPPAASAPDSDNDIIEGPSRISLNCPISFRRIKTPIKGQLCKHLQCFDFDNYLGMNSRRPLWRCPHCSQSVCFDDIRIDRNMVKVLKEIGTNVSHVSISSDGSWEAVSEADDHSDKPQDKPPLHQESAISTGADILDLTEDDDDNDMDACNSRHNDDNKPYPAQLQDQPINDQNGGYMNMNNISNENGRYNPIPAARLVTRNLIAVQALPVQTSVGMVSGDRQQQSSRFHMNPHQVSRMISALPSMDMGSQQIVLRNKLDETMEQERFVHGEAFIPSPTLAVKIEVFLSSSNRFASGRKIKDELATINVKGCFKTPELFYRSLAAKLVLGMPFKDLATVDSILLRELPPADDKDARLALKRLIDVSMGVITPLSEQLTKPLPNALVLVNLKELSTGANKLLQEGTRLVVSVRGDEPYEELEILKSVDATMILHDLPYTEEKTGRVHAARRLFEYLSENSLNFPVLHHIQFPKGIPRDDLVISAGANAGALLVDGLGDGILLEAPDQDFEFLRNTSFNLLQGCRMRNTKTTPDRYQFHFLFLHLNCSRPLPPKVQLKPSKFTWTSMFIKQHKKNWVHHDLSHVSSQTVQQFGPCSGPPLSGYWYPSALPAADRFNSHQNQQLNQWIPNPIWSLAQLPPQICYGGVGPTTSHGNNQQFHHYAMAATQQAIQIRSMAPAVQAPVQTFASSMPVASSEVQGGPGVLEGSADQNQRPTRRMRGSLSGRDYSEALNHLIIHPTQPVQAARPPVLNAPRPAIPPHLQVLMANNRNAHGSQEGTNGSVLDSSNGGTTTGVLLPEK